MLEYSVRARRLDQPASQALTKRSEIALDTSGISSSVVSEPVNLSGAVASVSVGERDSSAWRENEGESQAK